MSAALKLFVFFSVSSATLGYYNIRDDVHWFKNRDRITDRFLVGMIKGRNALCKWERNGETGQGVCLSNRECTQLGGMRGGGCSFLGTCCIIEKTCSETTEAKLSYFIYPKTPENSCKLTVKPINKDVCQIRLDFEKFSIGQPTQMFDGDSTSSYQCLNDAFTVSSPGAKLGFEHLCGENAGQHIYVPVNAKSNVVLNFQLNMKNTNVGFNDWRIRVHQLECARWQSVDINNIHSSLAVMHRNHHNIGHSDHNPDYYLKAPDGCLQYYPERQGSYETFNYNSGRGPYIGRTNYAICFNRTSDVCGISHKSNSFTMNYNVDSEYMVDCNPSVEASPETSQDYLQIPGGMINKQRSDYYCNSKLNPNGTVISVLPGPFSVVVRTDAFQANQRLERGFHIEYQLLTGGCDEAQ